MHLSVFQSLQNLGVSLLPSRSTGYFTLAVPERVYLAPPQCERGSRRRVSGCWWSAKCQVPASIYSRLVETRRGRQVPGSRRPVPLTRECRLVTHGLTTRWSRLRPPWVGSGNLATSAIRMRRRSSAGWRRTATSGWPCPSSTSPHGTGGCGPSSTLLDCSTGQ